MGERGRYAALPGMVRRTIPAVHAAGPTVGGIRARRRARRPVIFGTTHRIPGAGSLPAPTHVSGETGPWKRPGVPGSRRGHARWPPGRRHLLHPCRRMPVETIRTLIIDDEAPARLRLRKLLHREADIALVAECDNGQDALDAIATHNPDLVFLDVQLRDFTGFEVVDRMTPPVPPVVIFVTAYDAYALQAFDAHAGDYLLKPFSNERFQQALGRARQQLRARLFDHHRDTLMHLLRDLSGAPARPDRLVLKVNGRLVFMDVDEVDWIEAEGVYIRVHAGARSHLLRESLNTVEQRLDPRRFLRIHRSTIVNVGRIREVSPYFNGGAIVILQDGKQLKLSRTYREKLTATLG